MKKSLRSALLLLLTAVIWGSAFVAQSVGMDYVGPCTFLMSRSILGGLVLIPVIHMLRKREVAEGNARPLFPDKTLKAGLICGVILFTASLSQQVGMLYTSVANAGFVTSLYIIIVPIIGMLFAHKKVGLRLWTGAVMALCGVYLLCAESGLSDISVGDYLMLVCAIVFACHIMTVDHYGERIDGVQVAFIQFIVTTVLSGIGAFLTEEVTWVAIRGAAGPILYAGILSSGVAYTLQIVAQRDIDPTIATLIMSLEASFSALTGWIILGEALSPREILGCVLAFAAMILVQLPAKSEAA